MSFVHVVEIIMILAVIGLQGITFRRIYFKIKRLKDLNLHDSKVIKVLFPVSFLKSFDYSVIKETISQFNSEEYPDLEDGVELSEAALLYLDNDIDECEKIIREVNTYMLKNDDKTVNFNIVQDIVERNYQVLDEEINQGLPTPLYLGLAATMLGIIFGLWDMDTSSAGDVSTIGSLITGIGIAMTSSFIGVVLTTLLTSVFYKDGKKEADEEKNQFFSQMQADLLPELLRKGETGIEALNSNLERFTRSAELSIKHLEKITVSTSQTLKGQAELIERIDGMDISKLSASSIHIFDRLERNLESFDKFAAYWERLTKSLGLTNNLTVSLKDLVDKLSHVDSIAINIEQTISDYNKTMRFFTEHINSFNDMGVQSKQAVALADVAFKDAISELTKNASVQIQEFKKTGANIDIHLKDIGSDVANSLAIATKEHVNKLHAVYSDKLPAFEKLKQLDTLPEIHSAVQKSAVDIQSSEQATNAKLLQKLDNLEQAILMLAKNQKESQKQQSNKRNNNKTEAPKAGGANKKTLFSRLTGFFSKSQASSDSSKRQNFKKESNQLVEKKTQENLDPVKEDAVPVE
jgi:hypothetical protein